MLYILLYILYIYLYIYLYIGIYNNNNNNYIYIYIYIYISGDPEQPLMRNPIECLGKIEIFSLLLIFAHWC